MSGLKCDTDKFPWSPRLRQDKLLRLYVSNAAGLTDSNLLQEAAVTLYLRCKDIMAVYDAHRDGRVRCPQCYAGGSERYIAVPPGLGFWEKDALQLTCDRCGFSFTWREFRKSHSRRQLNAGGAVEAFSNYIGQFERNLKDNELMLAIDRLIHKFHHSLRSRPDLPTRIAGANLIEGKNTTEILRFLDDLTYRTPDDPRLQETASKWRGEVAKHLEG